MDHHMGCLHDDGDGDGYGDDGHDPCSSFNYQTIEKTKKSKPTS